MIFVPVVGNVEIKKIIAGEVINHDPQTSGGHTVQAVLSAHISKGSSAIVVQQKIMKGRMGRGTTQF